MNNNNDNTAIVINSKSMQIVDKICIDYIECKKSIIKFAISLKNDIANIMKNEDLKTVTGFFKSSTYLNYFTHKVKLKDSMIRNYLRIAEFVEISNDENIENLHLDTVNDALKLHKMMEEFPSLKFLPSISTDNKTNLEQITALKETDTMSLDDIITVRNDKIKASEKLNSLAKKEKSSEKKDSKLSIHDSLFNIIKKHIKDEKILNSIKEEFINLKK
jgi:hypothetical protein